MLMLDVDDDNVVHVSFRDPSPQFLMKVRAAKQEDTLRQLLRRFGDNLDVHIERMQERIPRGQIARH